VWVAGQIQRHIAESYANFQAGRSYAYHIGKFLFLSIISTFLSFFLSASHLDLSTYGNGLDADGCKLYCAQMGKQLADTAIQILGGNGYIGDYVVERFLLIYDFSLAVFFSK